MHTQGLATGAPGTRAPGGDVCPPTGPQPSVWEGCRHLALRGLLQFDTPSQGDTAVTSGGVGWGRGASLCT